MAYDPTVPDQANLVRTASGDLALMQGNFQALAPVYSGLAISGVEPSAAIRGFYFGDPTNHKRFFIQSDGNDLFSVQRNLSGETSPDWQTAMYLSQVSGEEVCFTVPVSGVTPTLGFHFATKDYVDTNPTFSGLADTTITSPTSGQIPMWNGSAWANTDHIHTLNSLTDVSVVSPASGEVLFFNGSQWTADSLALSNLSGPYIMSGDLTIDKETDTALTIAFDSGSSTTVNTEMVFRDRGVDQWLIRKDENNHFHVRDVANDQDTIHVEPNAGDNALYIEAGGGVGLGANPDASYRLDVRGNSAKVANKADATLYFDLDSGATAGQISVFRFMDQGVSKWEYTKTSDNNWWLYDSANAAHVLKINASPGSAETLFLISGLVGVGGQPEAGYALDVKNDAYVRGDLRVGGDVPGFVENLDHYQATVASGDAYTLRFYAYYDFDVKELRAKTGAGTCDLTFTIDGVAVTGLSGVTVSGTETGWTATATESAVVGNTLAIDVEDASGCTGLVLSLKTERT